jgi:antitoxin MazE
MKARVQKWGNSLALRIPKSFANEAGLSEDSPVELSIVKGKMVVAPATKEPLTLDQLLKRVTDDNIHGEVSTGRARGREAW